jgi:NAD(P)-dependent dehydrogenase (short-subunit alcohol dehydrogenase family)
MNNSPPHSSVADQVVVITGAGSGIGQALAYAFSNAGARVIVNDLNVSACHAVAEEIGAISCPGDAATSEGVSNLVHQTLSELGRIDIFCANAGIEGGRGLESTDAQWERSLEVNTLSHVRAARLLVPHWLEAGRRQVHCHRLSRRPSEHARKCALFREQACGSRFR